MRRVYICSPYRAENDAELDRNINYARELTRQAIESGLAPITPHLYMTQCLDEGEPWERELGMAAGEALLKGCDFVLAGIRHGISEGMRAEIKVAEMAGIEVVNADKLHYKLEHDRKRKLEEYADLHLCEYCEGDRLHSCTGYKCKEPYKRAYEQARKQYGIGGFEK